MSRFVSVGYAEERPGGVESAAGRGRSGVLALQR